MIRYSIVRCDDERVVAVLVEKDNLGMLDKTDLISAVQDLLALPVMLVTPDHSRFLGARAHAEFDAEPFLQVLMASSEVEWSELTTAFCTRAC